MHTGFSSGVRPTTVPSRFLHTASQRHMGPLDRSQKFQDSSCTLTVGDLLPEPKLHFKLGQELPYFWGHMLCGICSLSYSFPIHPLLLTVKSQFEKFRERGQFRNRQE